MLTSNRMSNGRYAFGPFQLDVAERELRRDGQVVTLGGKAFDTLVLLVQGAGQLQSHHSLMDRLWPSVTVELNTLQYNVSLVRRALGGTESVELRTVRGQGYRLCADPRQLGEAGAGRAVVADTGIAGDGHPIQRTHFCAARDGVRLAYALHGDGPPTVKIAHWVSHLDLDAHGPLWSHWLDLMTQGRRLVRYDGRGNGLADWQLPSIAFEDFISDLAAVMDAAGVDRAPLVGFSQGAAVAVAFAARFPERVSALLLCGGCARGWRTKRNPKLTEHFEALMVLIRQAWGKENAAVRQLLTANFMPHATPEEAAAFNELQLEAVSAENAARLLSIIGDIDVTSDLGRVRAPTLVVHCRGDSLMPLSGGKELASGIAGARFVSIESDNHLLMGRELGWARFVQAYESFFDECVRPSEQA